VTVRLEWEGARDIERALARLPRAVSRRVARAAMKKALEPVRATADAMTGRFSVAIGSTLEKGQRRGARADKAAGVMTIYVGPVHSDGSHAPLATIFEFRNDPARDFRGSVSRLGVPGAVHAAGLGCACQPPNARSAGGRALGGNRTCRSEG